jgi:hypothetical protein
MTTVVWLICLGIAFYIGISAEGYFRRREERRVGIEPLSPPPMPQRLEPKETCCPHAFPRHDCKISTAKDEAEKPHGLVQNIVEGHKDRTLLVATCCKCGHQTWNVPDLLGRKCPGVGSEMQSVEKFIESLRKESHGEA